MLSKLTCFNTMEFGGNLTLTIDEIITFFLDCPKEENFKSRLLSLQVLMWLVSLISVAVWP